MELRDFDALSFDCYGTLIDWETGIIENLAPLTERLSPALSRDRILEAHAATEHDQQSATPAMPYSRLLAVVFKRLSEEWDVAVSWEQCLEYGRSVPKWPAFPDSGESLHRLKERYKLVILSNVDNASFAGSNARLGVGFDAICTAEDVGSYKPETANFSYMFARLERMGIRKERVLHVAESMFHDHVPANALGVANCHIYRRHGQEGFGATVDPGTLPKTDFRFDSMKGFADACLA